MTSVLFFTPVLPCHTGHGSAIRAGIALQLLSERHRVTVVQLGLWQTHAVMDDSLVRTHAAAHHIVPHPATPEDTRTLVEQHLSQTEFAGVYVFRLAAATFALQVIALLHPSSLPAIVDVDDDECTRLEKFIPLREAAGDAVTATAERARLQHLRNLQRLLISRFDRCLLAAQPERDALAHRYPGYVFDLLPNVVRLPKLPSPLKSTTTGNLLFLGSLNYLPNEDAALYLCDSILPLLRELTPDVSLRIVGTGVPLSIRDRNNLPGVTVVGPVSDVATEYARASVFVVPIRAGSGTRIKILEAFSYGVPVVSTSTGAEGLDVAHGVHLLLADTPEVFADCCRRLLSDSALASRLAADALQWLKHNHTLENVRPLLHSLFP